MAIAAEQPSLWRFCSCQSHEKGLSGLWNDCEVSLPAPRSGVHAATASVRLLCCGCWLGRDELASAYTYERSCCAKESACWRWSTAPLYRHLPCAVGGLPWLSLHAARSRQENAEPLRDAHAICLLSNEDSSDSFVMAVGR